MIETARKEDLFLDKKLIIPENRLDAIRIMARLHPVVGDQPTNEKDQPNTNNPVLDLACTILNIHDSGVGDVADLRKIQNEPPSFFFEKGAMWGISSLKGNGILHVIGGWRDKSGLYAMMQFYYTTKEIVYRTAETEEKWGDWISVLTNESNVDYNKLLNVPITSTLSNDKTKISSIYAVNLVNTTASNAQKTANTAVANAKTADGKAVAAQGTANTAVTNAKMADGKAVAAQNTANTAVTNAKIADGKAVSADKKAVDAMNEAKKKRNQNDFNFNTSRIVIDAAQPGINFTAEKSNMHLYLHPTNDVFTFSWEGDAVNRTYLHRGEGRLAREPTVTHLNSTDGYARYPDGRVEIWGMYRLSNQDRRTVTLPITLSRTHALTGTIKEGSGVVDIATPQIDVTGGKNLHLRLDTWGSNISREVYIYITGEI